ncbi:MAG: winged helix-turn-helix transcriptional regulator, partial [Gaiellaceae bacterium]
MSKVLIIEDDDVIAQGMARHLSTAGFDPLWVNKGESGLARLRYERPDVCVLDLMLPGVDGWKLIETARAEGIGTPIVVVSARGTEHDRVHALEIGADDYLVKPFSMKELVARVRAAARRGVRVQDERRGEPIDIEELRIDPLNVQAYVGGQSAELTPTEFRLLYALALERGRVVTRDELLQKVWGRRQTHRDRTVDVFVRKIRDKLEAGRPAHTFVQTRYGVGYKLEPVEIEELLIDPRNVQAYVGGQTCELTPTEFRLLYALALERGRVVTRDELLQKIWGRRQTRRDRTVDVFVRKLREKIDRRATVHSFIQTRYGVGY